MFVSSLAFLQRKINLKESFSVKYLSPGGKMMNETQASGSNLDCFAEHPLSCTIDTNILTFDKNLYCDLIFKHWGAVKLLYFTYKVKRMFTMSFLPAEKCSVIVWSLLVLFLSCFFPVRVNRIESLHSWLSDVKGYWTRNAADSLLHLKNWSVS